MWRDSIKMAVNSLKSARWRSLLTMLGTIVGVASIVTIVSLGEGLKHQVKREVGTLGNDIITIQPGQVVKRDKNGKITGVNVFVGGGTLSEQDVQLVGQASGVKASASLSLIPAVAQTDDQRLANTPVIATTAGMPEVLHHSIAYGGFFSADEDVKNVAILGKTMAVKLFGENVPIGRSFRLRGQNFLVRGVFDEFTPNVFLPTTDFNNAIFIPYGAAKNLLGMPPPISHILAKAKETNQVDETVAQLTLNLLSAHAGQADFTILKPAENLAATRGILDVITQVTAAIAGIALLMGGVGIMNIMLVAVTERTREIGIRKAVGATNRQVLNQFVVEAGVLSFVGGIIGIFIALLGSFLIRLFTALQPAIPLWIVGLSLAMAMGVGIIFGVAPALKAARKDPIEALRYE